MNILSCIGPWGTQVVTFEFDGHLSQGIAYYSTTIVMRRNAFQANRKEEVLHSGRGPSPLRQASREHSEFTPKRRRVFGVRSLFSLLLA